MLFLIHAFLLLFAAILLDGAWDQLKLTNAERLEIMNDTLSAQWGRTQTWLASVQSGEFSKRVEGAWAKVQKSFEPEEKTDEVPVKGTPVKKAG